MANYNDLTDDQLVGLLFTEADRLPRSAVDEFVRRGERLVEPLADIVSNEFKWRDDETSWWAAVHAVFILGAIGGRDVVLPLAKGLRWAAIYDCDWVCEAIPSILGKTAASDIGIIKTIAGDKSSDWYVRASAIDGLAATTIGHPELEGEIFSFIGNILNDESDDWETRGSAGNVLLDFLRTEYRGALIAHGKKGMELKELSPFFVPQFSDRDVEKAFSEGKKDLDNYEKDWLSFYSDGEISRRQKRWKEEDASEKERESEEKARVISSGNEPFIKERYIGRNDPCPCGSGKKYKKCCLEKS